MSAGKRSCPRLGAPALSQDPKLPNDASRSLRVRSAPRNPQRAPPRRGRLSLVGAGLVVTLCSATSATGEERLDHHGAVGLLIGGGINLRQAANPGGTADTGLRLPLELGGTYNVGHDSNELKLVLRAELLGPKFIGVIYGGYRGYFGHEAWKTFFDLDLRVDVLPQLTAGPRMGLGAQYELNSLVGVYSSVAAHVGAGQGIRFGAEVTVGVQLRSFLLE